jgi:hypothetical protein
MAVQVRQVDHWFSSELSVSPMLDSTTQDSKNKLPRRPFAARDRFWGVVSLLYLLILVFAALSLLICTWPPTGGSKDWFGRTLETDQRHLILVAIAGGIGSIIYCMRSATWYLGNLEFRRSWAPWYLAQPFIGAALGAMTYIVFRAGLIQPSNNGAEAVNLFGFLAISALVGLYTEQALTQLKVIAETVLRPAPKGEDTTKHLRPGEEPPPEAGQKGKTP